MAHPQDLYSQGQGKYRFPQETIEGRLPPRPFVGPTQFMDPTQFARAPQGQGPTQFMDPTQFAAPRPQGPTQFMDPTQFAAPRPQGPQQNQGPTYGQERKRLAEESAEADRAPEKIKRVEQKNSDGTATETISNAGAKQVIKRDANGKILSTTTTTNDAVGDPIDGAAWQGPRDQGPVTSVAEAEQGPFVSPTDAEQGFGLRRPHELPDDNYGVPYADFSQNIPIMPGQVPDFTNPVAGEAEAPPPALGQSQMPPPQAAAQFQAPPRTWANMDWTGVRKLTDDIYGTKIAEGSVDPYVAEYERALKTFNANKSSGKDDSSLAWAKFNDSKKTLKDRLQREEDQKIEDDIIAKDKIKEDTRRSDREFRLDKKKAADVAKYRQQLIDRGIGIGGGGGNHNFAPAGTDKGDMQRLKRDNAQATLDRKRQPTISQSKAEATASTGAQAERSYQGEVRKGAADKSFDPTSSSEFIDNFADMPQALTFLQSPAARGAHSSSNRWLNTLLRDETGAAMPEHEVPRFRRMYYPGPGDTPAIVASKEEARRIKINSAKLKQGLKGQELLDWYAKERAKDLKILEAFESKQQSGGKELENATKDVEDLEAKEKKLMEELGL